MGVDAVVDLIVEQKNERIDEAVESGRIEATDADEMRAEVEERVTTRVNEGRPERGDGEASAPVATVGHAEVVTVPPQTHRPPTTPRADRPPKAPSPCVSTAQQSPQGPAGQTLRPGRALVGAPRPLT